ncbi:MAG: hypothetical protein NTW54_13245 [Bacteroidetes bacterium]|nr:hypothetical protein [Bacteroidota bacterium]
MNTITLKHKHSFKNTLFTIIGLISFTIATAQNGIGVNTTAPKSNFEVYGSFGQKVTTVTGTTTLDATHSLVICNNGASTISVTLPDATACLGRIYTIKRNATSTANVTVVGNIDGVSDLVLKYANDAATLFSNGTDWSTKGSYVPKSSWNLTGNTATDPATNFIGTTDAQPFILKTNGVERIRVLSGGNIGIGVTVPTAHLHLMAGSTAAGKAPLKFTTQAAGLTTVEQGTMELIGNSLQFTQLAKRRGIMMSQSTITSSTTIANDATESTALITAEHGANYLEVGKMEEIRIYGTIQQNSTGGGVLEIRTKYAGSQILIAKTVSAYITSGTPFEIHVICTCRSTGVSGTMQVNAHLDIDGVANPPDAQALVVIDTTLPQNTTVTAKWTVANATNILTVQQGRVICIDPNR